MSQTKQHKMKTNKIFFQLKSTLVAFLILLAFMLPACDDDDVKYELNLSAYPKDVAELMGAGRYIAGDTINVSATILSEEYEIVNWINADKLFVNDSLDFEYVIPDHDENLTANFKINHAMPGEGVIDAEGNIYETIMLGSHEWMAENLRVSIYQDGSPIQTNLSNEDWENASEGAFAVFDPNHNDAEGISSHEEMIEAYGKLYNWHAVADGRGLCPEGWKVPAQEDYEQMINYLEEEYDISNINEADGMGNTLKSSHQVGHPWGADHAEQTHPRWNEHMTHYGTDNFGFSAHPAGYREYNGNFFLLGYPAYFWTSTESAEEDIEYAYYYYINTNMGSLNHNNRHKELGLSVRCIKE